MQQWLEQLRSHSDYAKKLAADIPKALADPDLTLDQASRMHRLVEAAAQKFDDFVEEMNGEDLPDSMYDTADALEEMWSAISVAVANKVRTMQGLPPIEIPDDDDDED